MSPFFRYDYPKLNKMSKTMNIIQVINNGRYDLVEVEHLQELPDIFPKDDGIYSYVSDGKTFMLEVRGKTAIVNFHDRVFYFQGPNLSTLLHKTENETRLANVKFPEHHLVMQELMGVIRSDNCQMVTAQHGQWRGGCMDKNSILPTIRELTHGINNWHDITLFTGVCSAFLGGMHINIRFALTQMWIDQFGTPYIQNASINTRMSYPIGGYDEYQNCRNDNTFAQNPLRLHYAIWMRNKLINLYHALSCPTFALIVNHTEGDLELLKLFKGVKL